MKKWGVFTQLAATCDAVLQCSFYKNAFKLYSLVKLTPQVSSQSWICNVSTQNHSVSPSLIPVLGFIVGRA